MVTVQFCECCDDWSQYIYNIYKSGNYDFHYVEMITFDNDGYKLNLEANKWRENYSISAFPTTVFDNDHERVQGNNPGLFTDKLNSSGNRIVADISANMTVSWLGNGTIEVEVSINNNEQSQYNGFIRVYITEIVSRYNTYYGNPFHFGFLDFAINKEISISAEGNYFNNVTWNGNEHEDTHGDDFGDIESDNIQLVLEIFNTDNDGYVDETVIARVPNNPPSQPSNPDPLNGEIDVDVNSDLSWNCSDPDNNTLTYDIYFGTSNPPPFVSNNKTENYYDPGKMDNFTKYYWQIIAWDPYSAFNTSPIWEFTTGEYTNDPPGVPTITGPMQGNPGEELTFTFNAEDPDGDDIRFFIDWGDGNSDTTDFVESGIDKSVSHIWTSEDTYTITAYAEDEFGLTGPSTTLTVTIPRNKVVNRPILQFLQSHPNLFPLLQKLLQQIGFGM